MKRFIIFIILSGIIFVSPAFAVDIWSLPVEGDFRQTIKYVDVHQRASGLSFKYPGWHYLTELGLNSALQTSDGWISSFQMQMRKTDDNEIDLYHNGVRLLSWLIETRNENFDVQIGNIYSSFTDLTLSRSLEGISCESTFDRVNLKTVISQAYRHDTSIPNPRYLRYVFGQRGSYQVIRNGKWLNDLKMGMNVVYNIDDIGTVKEMEQNATGLRNYVWSLDQELRLLDNWTFYSEFARSGARDTNTFAIDGHRVGNAIKVRSTYSIEPFNGSFQFHRIDPTFFTDSGSASIDQEMYQYNFSFLPASRFATDLSYSTYHDNLDSVPERESTKVNNPAIGFRITPFKNRTSFRMEPRFDWRKQRNTLGTAKSQTSDARINLYDTIKEYNLNWGYDYRKYRDRSSDTSDSSNNIVNTLNWGVSRTFAIGKQDVPNPISLAPTLNYTYTREVYPNPTSQMNTTNNVAVGLNFNVGQKFSSNFNYSFTGTRRQADDTSTTNDNGGVDINYNLSDATSVKTYFKINKQWQKGGNRSVREIESGVTYSARF